MQPPGATGSADDQVPHEVPRPVSTSLVELARVFLKLGLIGFGGPAAHIGLMENELVRRRHWVSREEFLDLLAAVNLIPGPNSTEMAIHIGRLRAGVPGLLVAGACFILPAMLIVMAIAWAYVRYGTLPQVSALLYGIKPVMIAVIAQALWSLARTSVKTTGRAALLAGAGAAAFLWLNELLILLVAGLVWASVQTMAGTKRAVMAGLPWLSPGGDTRQNLLAAAATAGTAASAVTSFGLWPMFLFFLKVGAVLYGSGYVLLAFLQADLVERWRWLTEAQLLDAVAVGQVTPGPLFTTATFIGYVLGGAPAAVVATVGIFLPAFVFVALSGPLIPRLRRSPIASAFLDGVVLASLALMALVTWRLGRAALVDSLTVALAVAAGVALIRFRVNSAWLVLGGAAIGLASAWWH